MPSEDLAAEITIRLRAQMAGPLDEIKKLFKSLNETVKSLDLSVKEFAARLDDLTVSGRPLQQMRELQTQMRGTESTAAKTEAALGDLALSPRPLEQIKAIDAEIGTVTKAAGATQSAFDDWHVPQTVFQDVERLRADVAGVGAAAKDTQDAMRTMAAAPRGAGARAAAGVVHGARGAGIEGPKNAGDSVDWLGGAITGAIGLAAIRSYADFESALGHTAITEKLRGPAAMAQIAKLAPVLEKIALATGTSSQKLAEAEFFLVTTGMNKKTIAEMMPALAKTSTAYNVPVPEMTQAAFTLHENLGIKGAQTETGLAMLAYASKLGHFGLGDFGLYLPGAGGKAVSLGMKGTRGEATIASALEVIRRNTGTSQEASTELGELMHYMTSPMGMRMFDQTKKMRSLLGPAGRALMEKYHIRPLNLPQYLNAERAHGVDAVNAMVDYFKPMLAKIKSPTDRSALLGLFFHNQNAQQAMIALLQYAGRFGKDQKTLMHVDPRTVNEDFKTAWGLAITQVRLFDEEMKQLERDIGKALLGPLKLVNDGLHLLIGGIDDLNKVEIPVLKTGLGDLALGAASAYGTLKAFGALRGRIFGAKEKEAAKGAGGVDEGLAAGAKGRKATKGGGVVDEALDAAKRGVEAAPEGAEAGPWGLVGTVIAAALGSKIEDSMSKSIKQAGADVGDLIVRALGGHVVDVHVTNHETGSLPLPPPAPPALPRATPPRGPFLNRP